MTVQKQKLFASIVVAIMFLNCTGHKSVGLNIKNILTGHKVIGVGYVYDDEPLYVIGSDSISLRVKVEYDSVGNLKSLTSFKPEGALTYSKSDLLNEPALLDYMGVNLANNWKLINDSLITDGRDAVAVKAFGEKRYMTKDTDRIIIYELY